MMEGRLRAVETRTAEDAIRREQMSSDIATIKSNGVWMIRLFVGGFIAAFVAFITGGGLALPI